MTPRVLLPAAVAVAAVALGLLLGLVPPGKVGLVGPLRTFALAAALTVVLTHLLPEALEDSSRARCCWWRRRSDCRIGGEADRLARKTFGGGHAGLIAAT